VDVRIPMGMIENVLTRIVESYYTKCFKLIQLKVFETNATTDGLKTIMIFRKFGKSPKNT
jgi:hypothetical protein